MVSPIDSNFAGYNLTNIKYQLEMIDSDNGIVNPAQKEGLTSEVNYFINNLGDKKDVQLTLTEVENMIEAQASKQLAPDMNMDLDLDLSEPKKPKGQKEPKGAKGPNPKPPNM